MSLRKTLWVAAVGFVLTLAPFAMAAEKVVSVDVLPGGPGKAIALSADGVTILVDLKGKDGNVLVRDGKLVTPALPRAVKGGNPRIVGISADGKALLVSYHSSRQSIATTVVRDGKKTLFAVYANALSLRGASVVAGLSADGSVVVGTMNARPIGQAAGSVDGKPTPWARATRWVGRRATLLGTLGGAMSSATGVSADGSVVVGYSLDADGKTRAFRWADKKMTSLGTIGAGESKATGVSADGKVVYGTVTEGETVTGFIWKDGKMTSLGTVGGKACLPTASNSDGSVIIGMTAGAKGKAVPFWWRKGKVSMLAQAMTTMGVALDGWTLRFVGGVSADAKTIVGAGLKEGKMLPFAIRLP